MRELRATSEEGNTFAREILARLEGVESDVADINTGGLDGTPAVRYSRTTALALAYNANTVLDCPTLDLDTHGTVSGAGAGTWRMTPGVVGDYRADAYALVNVGLGVAWELALDIRVNGANSKRPYRHTGTTPAIGNGLIEVGGSAVVPIASATDYIDVIIYQVNGGGGALNTVAAFAAGTFISVNRVR